MGRIVAMTPAKVNLKLYQGATFRKRFRWLAPGGVTPISLVGATARMQIRKDKKSPALLTLSTAGGQILIDGPNGAIDLHLDAGSTAAITWSGGAYDLEVVMAGGDVVRLVEGSVSVSPEITRDD
jgi:hypothetical protein